MLLIDGEKIKQYYGDRLILDIDNVKVYSEDRIGVVGINGIGKTTLINILIGRLKPDEGLVKVYGTYGYISQLEEYEGEDVDWEKTNGYREVNTWKKINSFGAADTWNNYLSGGEKTRFKLAQGLAKDSNIIFADEPTSNLDMEGVLLLEKGFKEYAGALVVISHDREFLDKLCNKILEVEDSKIKFYNGNYTEYRRQKKQEKERAYFEYDQYEKEKRKLEESIGETKGKAKDMKKAPARMGNSEARLHKMGNQKAKGNLDKAAKNMISRIEHLEVKEKPREINKIKLDALSSEKLYSKVVISGRNINKAFGEKIIFKNAEFDIGNGAKVALIGPNGSGKSTLIKMILSGEEAFKIAKGVKVGYFSQEMDILNQELSLLENIMKDSIYDETFARILIARLLFKRDDVYKRVNMLSGGERVKASLAKIFLQDINVLILDEPTNYLDIYSLEAVEEALKDYDRTLLLVSHDRRFVASTADHILSIEDKRFKVFKGTYEEYLERKDNKTDINKEDIQNKSFILQNRLSGIVGRLSMPSKNDDIMELDKEYHKILLEMKALREKFHD